MFSKYMYTNGDIAPLVIQTVSRLSVDTFCWLEV